MKTKKSCFPSYFSAWKWIRDGCEQCNLYVYSSRFTIILCFYSTISVFCESTNQSFSIMDGGGPMFKKNENVKAYNVRSNTSTVVVQAVLWRFFIFISDKHVHELLRWQRGQLYDAIITEIAQDPGGDFKYKVHYKRWNKRLDEFLSGEKITKIDSECAIETPEQVSSGCRTSRRTLHIERASIRILMSTLSLLSYG